MGKSLESIIIQGENENTKFKESFSDGVVISLVAFANTSGGRVFIGINDGGQIVGAEISKESYKNWINEIKTKTSPSLIPDIFEVIISNKMVICAKIQEYPIKPVAYKGRYYKRISSSNHIISISEAVNMHLSSMNTSWDYHLDINHSPEDISLSKVIKSIDIMQSNNISINEDPVHFLTKRDLLRG